MKENYPPHKFKTKILKVFDTRELAYEWEVKIQQFLKTTKNPLYINKRDIFSYDENWSVSKSVTQLSIMGEYIRKFKSITEAGEIFKPAQSNPTSIIGNISACLKGKTRTAYGFIWVYSKEFTHEHDYSLKNITRRKPFLQIDKDGVVVSRWGSIADAVKGLGLKSPPSRDCGKISGGYFWYSEELFNNNKEDILNTISEYNNSYKVVPKVNYVYYDGSNKIPIPVDEYIPERGVNDGLRQRFINRVKNKRLYKGKYLTVLEHTPIEECDKMYKDELVRISKFNKGLKPQRIDIPIVQLSMSGELINEFLDPLDIPQPSLYGLEGVRKCLKKKQQCVGDSQWFYKHEYISNPDIGRGLLNGIKHFKYEVAQLSLIDNTIINLFYSESDAKRAMGGKGAINDVLRGLQSKSCGFGWARIYKPHEYVLGDVYIPYQKEQ